MGGVGRARGAWTACAAAWPTRARPASGNPSTSRRPPSKQPLAAPPCCCASMTSFPASARRGGRGGVARGRLRPTAATPTGKRSCPSDGCVEGRGFFFFISLCPDKPNARARVCVCDSNKRKPKTKSERERVGEENTQTTHTSSSSVFLFSHPARPPNHSSQCLPPPCGQPPAASVTWCARIPQLQPALRAPRAATCPKATRAPTCAPRPATSGSTAGAT